MPIPIPAPIPIPTPAPTYHPKNGVLVVGYENDSVGFGKNEVCFGTSAPEASTATGGVSSKQLPLLSQTTVEGGGQMTRRKMLKSLQKLTAKKGQNPHS